MMQRVITGLE